MTMDAPIRDAIVRRRWRLIGGYALATVGVGLLVAAFLPSRGNGPPLDTAFGFLALVVLASAVGGLGAGLLASVVAFLAFNFFFLRPYGTFVIASRDDVVVLFVFLLLSVLISVLMARATSRAEAAEARERELRALQDLSRALVEQGPDPASYGVIVRLVVSRFGFSDGALFFQEHGDGRGLDELVTVNAGPGEIPITSEGPGVERLALNVGNRNLGLLILRGDRAVPDPERRVLRAFSDQLALVLERDRALRVAVGTNRATP
jgi:two-component system, OmpR family, sensor histidine kinase KdpD